MSKIPFKLITFLFLLVGFVAYSQGFLDSYLKSDMAKGVIRQVKVVTTPVLVQIAKVAPFVGRWLSPINRIEDVSERDFIRLQKAASADLKTEGPKLALALATSNLKQPRFYVSTNLPDGARFKIVIQGVSHTLLNRFRFLSTSGVEIANSFGVTSTVKGRTGKPVPKGEFKVFIYEISQQPPAVTQALAVKRPSGMKIPGLTDYQPRVVDLRVYFLGGQNDNAYKVQLKKFHDLVDKRSKDELFELNQFHGTFLSQFNKTMARYSQLSRGRRTPAKIKAWGSFSQGWARFTGHMNEKLAKWSENEMKENVLYSHLYQRTRDIGLSIGKVHRLQSSYFSSSGGQVLKTRQEIRLASADVAQKLRDLENDIRVAKKTSLLGGERL